MECTGCNRKATHLVHAQLQPHCTMCMLEALCSEPTPVIDIDCYQEAMYGKEVTHSGISSPYRMQA